MCANAVPASVCNAQAPHLCTKPGCPPPPPTLATASPQETSFRHSWFMQVRKCHYVSVPVSAKSAACRVGVLLARHFVT